jgi:hypothetical protein
MKYKVHLQGYASATVEVEAEDYVSAQRAAIKQAPSVPYVRDWTPVSTSQMEDVPRETSQGEA